jgi:hypothetical protein
MAWTDRKQIAVPASRKQEANNLAFLIDPDVGGAQTFEGEATHSIDGTAPATHIVANTQLQQDTYDLLTTAGPMEIMDHVQALAEERDRKVPDWGAEKIEKVIAEVEVGAGYEEVQEVDTELV